MRNPHQIISLSGGLASAASAIVAYEEKMPFSLVFADTLIEHEDLYRFIQELAAELGKPIHWLKDGRDPWDVFVANSWIGNSRTAHCSAELKTAQVQAWMEKHHFFSDHLVLGMYLDEEERLDRARERWCPQQVRSLLIDYKIFPGEAEKLVRKYVDEIPELYKLGFPHNNCGGMCVRAGQGQFARLLETRPEFYAQQEARNLWAEQQIVLKGGKPRGFIRVVRNKRTTYMNMRQFRLWIEAGNKPANYEMGGCGCFVDDGPVRK